MTLSLGSRVGGYVLKERLGAGGQAEVWRAEDPLAPELRWALKLVHVENVTPRTLQRLRREAAELARLRHESVVHCFGLFEDSERSLLGLVMEFVEGKPFSRLLRDARFDEALRTLALGHVARALAHVHAQELIHRDVKLDNVLVTEAFFRTPEDPNTIKLIDFGIVIEAANPQPLTRAGHVVGTAPYLAPEQLEPKHWTGPSQSPACDVFSFGILAWRLLSNDTQAHPTHSKFHADLDEYAIAYRRAEQDRWPPEFDNPRWNAFFKSALALHPRDRLQNGTALVDALRKLPTLDDPALSLRRVLTIPSEPPSVFDPPVASIPPFPESQGRRRISSMTLAFVLGVGALLGLCAIVGYLLLRTPTVEDEPPLPAPASIRR